MKRLLLIVSILSAACSNNPAPTNDASLDARRDTTTSSDTAVMCMGDAGRENTLVLCSDGCDNDGDRFADCNDFNCCNVRTCTTGSCAMPRDGGRDAAPACDAGRLDAGGENTAERCGNGCDDDGDGFADCNDFDCCGVVVCAAGSCAGRDGSLRDSGPTTDSSTTVDSATVDSSSTVDSATSDANSDT